MGYSNTIKISLLAGAVALVSACSTEQVVDTGFDTGAFVGRTAVKGAVGAGKLAYRGTAAAVRRAQTTE
ncbi:hypothetical protein ABMC89_17090 [Sulfitobacter sp. HNIBRBA3233]|uniref:hypothetical protein n=1 Tax=Sulfitobacter marinivivus TaxID=3158558 RepID=UPI0032DFB1C8